MSLSKNSSTRLPSRLSTVAVAVISINAAFISANTFAEDTTHLTTLVVTGEKIDKDIKDTTTAVTVITEDELANNKVNDVNDIVVQAPNVTTGGYGTINIRGVNGSGPAIGSNSFMTGGSPRVSTSVDGVTEAWGGYNFNPADIWDAQQVEVLRGPQSTVQGDNAIGGAVVIKTNDPSFEWESAVRAGIETYDNNNLKKNISAMVSGPLIEDELAFRLAIDDSQGEGWIDYKGTDSNSPDVDDSESLNVRGKLLWEPKNIDGLSSKLTVNHRKNDGEYLNWIDNSSSSISDHRLTLSDNNTRVQDSEVNNIALDINYDIDQSVSNSLQISYNDYTASFDEYPGNTLLDITEERFSLEDRVTFNSTDSKLSGFVGIYTATSDSTLDVNFGTSDGYDSAGTKTNLAAFGEATYVLTEKIRVSTGARLEKEEQDRDLVAWGNVLDQDTSDTIFLPKVSASYDITSSTTLGASLSKGYNSGGAALAWGTWEYYTFDPEEVMTFELSSKTRFNNGTMVNASIFYNEYSDYQAYTSTKLENLSSAHTYGAEVEVTAFATDNLELRGSIGTLSTAVDTTDADTSSWQDKELTFAPDLNVGVGFTQYIGNQWSISADATYVSEYYSSMDNTAASKAGDYITADTRIQYTHGDFTVEGYIKNITNEDVIFQTTDDTVAMGASRTIGLSATYRM
ncbi:TonB-dependent receptor [Marinomonas profundimaris]|uniref:Enterobactin-iron outermembrane receptor protein n=1 Tax=Marinomonas profundimaris TaxID=1208321 RepID=W1RSN8_9GAMM|nr:TonB-dependent receptor [Marinomonas profundimaris]ETI58654.1 enterobactin-iron outermembrane receptor protein [Marinomonas profundimaris]